MIKVICVCFLICFILSDEVSATPKKHSNLQYSAKLDREGKVDFRWNFTWKIIRFQISAPTSGWIGIGFSPSGTMKGADIIYAWMKNGKPHVLDMHAAENGLPLLDTKHNFRGYNMTQNGTHTILFVNKFLDTCDEENDFAITEDTTRVIYAYGDQVPDGDVPTFNNYHGSNRGVKSLLLLDSKLSSLEKEEMAENDVKVHEVRTSTITIPRRHTYYQCVYHQLPDFEDKQHIVQFEAIITPGNEKYVHHITMFHCNESLVTGEMLNTTEECYVNDEGDHWHYCAPVVVSWAVGMTTLTLPKHVGFPLGVPGAPKIVKLEIHYDNHNLEEGIVDESGFRILYTKHLRQNDAGILLAGHDVWPTLFVPQGSKDFVVQGHCSAECLGKIMEIGGVSELSVFGAFLHSHTAGHRMILRHYRNGSELQPIAKDLAYDFDFQETKLLSKEKKIHTGDNLIMECIYDTTKRRVPTTGGLATTEEMCFGFIMYYPKLDDAYCQSLPSASNLFTSFKARSISEAYTNAMRKKWTDEERRKFNQKQLTSPLLQNCRTLAGPIKGLKPFFTAPAIKAHFVESPGRCEKREMKKRAAKSHDLIKRSQNMAHVPESAKSAMNEMESSSNNLGTMTFFIFSTATISSAVILTVLGLIYYKYR